MPKSPKAKTVKEEDTKPYAQGEGPASKSSSKSPQKKAGGGDPWTPDQVWALFGALYKKDQVDWKAVSEEVGRPVKSCQNQYDGFFKKRLEGIIKGSVKGGS